MTAAQPQGDVSTSPTLPPSCAALLDQFGARIRAGLDATGLPYTAADVHAAIHEHAPAVAARLAELILLFVPPDRDDEHDETRIDMVLTAAFASVAAMLRRSFEEFGPADEADIAVTLSAAEFALLGRLQILAGTVSGGGEA